MYFETKAGYFGGALNTNPLLHTWSLSVEEQFYVLFPLALLALRPLTHRSRVFGLAAMAVLSLVYSQHMVLSNADQAYYSLFARFWELLLGSLLAITRLKPLPKPVNEAIVATGFLAILYAISQYQSSTVFPGLSALPPCLGTAAMLYGGRNDTTWTGRMVALPPFRFIGKISYSLYLWHWPLIVYCKLLFGGSHAWLAAALVVSVIASWLSWRFVEQPFRALSFKSDRFALIKGSVAAALLTFAVSFAMVAINAQVFPRTAQTAALQAFSEHYSAEADMRPEVCFLNSHYNDIRFFQRDVCLAYHPGADNLLLLGDSHSAQYFEALRTALPTANVMQASSSGCLPVLNSTGDPRCIALWRYATQTFLPSHHVNGIVLGGLWEQASPAQVIDTARWLTRFADRVYILGPNPEYLQFLPRMLIMAQYRGAAYVTRRVVQQPLKTDAVLAAAKLPPRVTYLSYFQTMCKAGCPMLASDGHPASFDDNHLTRAAATDAVRKWAGVLQPAP